MSRGEVDAGFEEFFWWRWVSSQEMMPCFVMAGRLKWKLEESFDCSGGLSAIETGREDFCPGL